MTRTSALLPLAALLGLSLSGCFTTQVQSGQQRTFAPVSTDRQWFTLGGLVQLSDAAGQECRSGLSYVESGYSGTDVLIGIGAAVLGNLAASAMCTLPDDPTDGDISTYALCSGAFSGLLPFMVGSRTVEYQCAIEGRAPGVQVPSMPLIPSQRAAAPEVKKRKLAGGEVGSFKLTKKTDAVSGEEHVTFSYTAATGLAIKMVVQARSDVLVSEQVDVRVVSESYGREIFSEDSALFLIINGDQPVQVDANWQASQLSGGVTHESVKGTSEAANLLGTLSELKSFEIRVGTKEFALPSGALARLRDWVEYSRKRLPVAPQDVSPGASS